MLIQIYIYDTSLYLLSQHCCFPVKLPPTVSRPVRLGVRHPSGTHDQFFFLLEIFFRQLRVCYFIAPSLTRGWVCNLLLLLVLASAVLLKTIFYCPNSWNSPNLEGQVPVFISPRNKVAQIYPRALGSLSVTSYDLQGYGGGILSRLHIGWRWSWFTTNGQSASLSWCRAPIWSHWPDFCFLSDDYGFLDVGHPLWWENGSVIYLYNCFWALPEQSLLGRSPTELTTIFYCLIWDSPNFEGQVPVFIPPKVKSHVTTDGQSVTVLVSSPLWNLWLVWKLLCYLCGTPSLTRGRVCLLSVTVSSI
jgi:hypothetical protein